MKAFQFNAPEPTCRNHTLIMSYLPPYLSGAIFIFIKTHKMARKLKLKAIK